MTRATLRAAELCAAPFVAVLLVLWFVGCYGVSKILDWKDRMKMSIQIVDDVRSRLYHFSTIALASGSAGVGLWVLMPNDMKARLSPQTLDWTVRILFGVLVWGFVGKFIKQPLRQPKDSNATDAPEQPE